MRLFMLSMSFAVALVGLQLLSTQPAEAGGRRHHMRDQFARQQGFYANPGYTNPGMYGNYAGYGAGCNMPMNSAFGQTNLPFGAASQANGNPGSYYGNPGSYYGNYGNNYGNGYGNGGFLRRFLGY
ncbi:MAG: hypothetical protein K2X29_07800 [Candidatus Obscuribacterales bacterium]|nr:hypothetical protein [Candidatus Obscuribacterales bacterium]